MLRLLCVNACVALVGVRGTCVVRAWYVCGNCEVRAHTRAACSVRVLVLV
jgi:hypothetical protein